ncbi:MAG: uncharacterized protein K0Q49_2239 [Haloplasmataceae bacterium]|jgi:hypothetical protein|nr:uncharacterized protein [Haloplasmataceae bacterium]
MKNMNDGYDEQILFDLSSKLTLSNDQFLNNNISDEDISMKDYTEDEITYEEHDNLRQRRNFKNEEIKKEITFNNQKQNTEEEFDDDKKFESKSIFQRFLQPEDEGYLLGRHQRDQEVKNVNNDVEESEKHLTVKEGSNKLSEESSTVYHRMFNDKNIIIHNHFYNFVGNPYHPENFLNEEENDISYSNNYNSTNNNKSLAMIETFKKTLNYSIILFIGYFIIKQIYQDISIEFEQMNIRQEIHRDQCLREYEINKCDEYGQLPALKEECLEWKVCINKGLSSYLDNITLSELSLSIISRIINESLNKIGHLNKLFILSIVLIWYLGNFICGYYKGLVVIDDNNNKIRKNEKIDNSSAIKKQSTFNKELICHYNDNSN